MREIRADSSGAAGPGPSARSLAVAVALAAGLAPAAPADGPAEGSGRPPLIELADGGIAAGELLDSDGPGTLRWQGRDFADPLEFPLAAVRSVRWPAHLRRPGPGGEHALELAGGDVLFGTLAGLDDDAAEVDTPGLGRLRVDRSRLHRITRLRAEPVYLGPLGLEDWQAQPEGDVGAWSDEEGHLRTDRNGASIRADLGLPAKADVEVELSWDSRPDFVLELGVDAGGAAGPHPFRFEVWGDDLVVYREAGRLADVASVQRLGDGPGRAHLLARLDQDAGRIAVLGPDGEELAEVSVPAAPPRPGPGVALTNLRGNVRLQRLRIGRWDGESPGATPGDRPGVRRVDGSLVEAESVRFDPEGRAFVARTAGGEERIGEADAAAIVFPKPPLGRALPVGVVLRDGSRLDGVPTQVDGGVVRLRVPGVSGPLAIPVEELRRIHVRHAQAPPRRGAGTPYLDLPGGRLFGELAGVPARPGASCIAWRPTGAVAASPLRAGVGGKVVFKEPPPARPAEPGRVQGVLRPAAPAPPPVRNLVVRPAPAPVGGLVVGPDGVVVRRVTPGRSVATPARPLDPTIRLVSGDSIPAGVETIDDRGVAFRSSMTSATVVPHDRVRSVDLPVPSVPPDLDEDRLERLLTLPRMQRDNPPTHLILSRDGDVLRGRLVAMDETTVRVELRLETRELPRDRVARIIWLHPDAGPGPGPDSPQDAPEADATRVQAVHGDGTRLTFVAERLDDAALAGTSDLLGACEVPLDRLDQVLLNGEIERAAGALPDGMWTLRPAPDPIAFRDGDGTGQAGGRAPGTESELVGKPAPDFDLERLDGGRFRLSDARGKVLVLDFWATWCGPCVRAMPQVDRVAREFRDRGVELVAVNIQEAPGPIRAMLERHKLEPTVALDRDGKVAALYRAHAIPQTVVVDREGVVARLFVGARPRLEDDLRAALSELAPEADPGP